MPRATQTQTSWFGGQIAEQRHGNAADELYNSSAATIKNLVVRPSGSLTRRPGTKFVARTKDNASALGNESKKVRLIPFVFGHESANNYVLEIGIGYIRFYKDNAILPGTNRADGDETHLTLTTTGVSADTATFPYTTSSHLDDLQFVQSADILFFTTPLVHPYKLSRSLGTDSGTWRSDDGYIWTLEKFVIKDGPYLNQQEDLNYGLTDTVITISGGTPTNSHTAVTGRKFINPNFGGATQVEAQNAYYDGATGNVDAISYFQVKNHGLQDGMAIELTGGTDTSTARTLTSIDTDLIDKFTTKQVDSHISAQFTSQNDGGVLELVSPLHGLVDDDEITLNLDGASNSIPGGTRSGSSYIVDQQTIDVFRIKSKSKVATVSNIEDDYQAIGPTAGTYTGVPLYGGSGVGAVATVVVKVR